MAVDGELAHSTARTIYLATLSPTIASRSTRPAAAHPNYQCIVLRTAAHPNHQCIALHKLSRSSRHSARLPPLPPRASRRPPTGGPPLVGSSACEGCALGRRRPACFCCAMRYDSANPRPRSPAPPQFLMCVRILSSSPLSLATPSRFAVQREHERGEEAADNLCGGG